jgi:hypothetical protein
MHTHTYTQHSTFTNTYVRTEARCLRDVNIIHYNGQVDPSEMARVCVCVCVCVCGLTASVV